MTASEIIRFVELPSCPSLELVAPLDAPGSRAVFGQGRQYQLSIARIWDEALPVLFCIGLHPITPGSPPAEQLANKVAKFAKANGFGAFLLVNTSALVAADTGSWQAAGMLAGDHNDEQLRRVVGQVCPIETRRTVLLAWGTDGPPLSNWLAQTKIHSRIRLVTLGQTDTGRPRHPSRLGISTPFQTVRSIAQQPSADARRAASDPLNSRF